MNKINNINDFLQAASPHFPVSHETANKLKMYASLLEKWQQKINLVSPSTIPDLWLRHFLDSAQLIKHLPKEKTKIMDFGSGAGFPGLVLAAFGHDIAVIESDQKKVAFMQEVARVAEIKTVTFFAERIENLPIQQGVKFITARALAPLEALLDYAYPHLVLGAEALFLKGDDAAEELTLAGKKWHMDFVCYPSQTEPSATVLHIRKAVRRDEPSAQFTNASV